MMFGDAYDNRRVLVTGHTGFKGSWLVLWLRMLGARVTAVSLPPATIPNHWDLLKLDAESAYVDIRDGDLIRRKIIEARPEVLFHLAAQPLVRRSYRQPIETWATNVMGTVHVLDACREVQGLAAVVVVTTDKCYENKEWCWGYREIDRLGGRDPYSASKAATEFATASYRRSFFCNFPGPLLASARAGNVIGGGDWSEDRLIPDLVRCVTTGQTLEVRSPNATRPWQHVLDCLSGYLLLGQQLLAGNKSCADAWNFGPDREANRQVKQLLHALKKDWPTVEWRCADLTYQPPENQLLHLDSAKARQALAWRPVWAFHEAVAATARWYREWLDRGDVVSLNQLHGYVELAKERGHSWATH